MKNIHKFYNIYIKHLYKTLMGKACENGFRINKLK